jgi:hypothetical protein
MLFAAKIPFPMSPSSGRCGVADAASSRKPAGSIRPTLLDSGKRFANPAGNMTVTPKIDLRKDRKPKKAGPRMAGTYLVWAIAALGTMSAAGSVFIWRDGKAPLADMPVVQVPALPQIVSNPKADREINRLNEAVRVLASERDRLATRLEQLERSVGDITATIPQQKRFPANEEPPPPPSAPPVQVINPPNPEPRPQGHNQLMPQQAPQIVTQVVPAGPQVATNEQSVTPDQPNTTRTEFGIDLGGEKTVDGLRARWATLRGNHGAALDGMRPLISIKEGQKAGTVELRLVAGPLANAAAAARVCARLQTSGVPCIPTVFDGQRLSLR